MFVDNKMRRDFGLPYIADQAVMAEMKTARRLVQAFNTADAGDFDKLQQLAYRLLGHAGTNLNITQPFYCDYGKHITVGDNFFANYNCVILDVGKVTIGNNVFLAPNVAIYTAGHPVHPEARNSMYEYGIPIKIGHNVWIGGNTVIMPGVIIGDNTVIGAGSVVTKDIPAGVIAVGNPCKVLREITADDKRYYYKNYEFDTQAWSKINESEQDAVG